MGTNPEARRRYRAEHAQEIAAYQHEWRQRNRGHIAEYGRRYKATLTPAQKFAWDSNKRAKLRGCEERLTADALPAGPCVYCGRSEEPIGWDHVRPLSRGGGNTAANIVRCCKPCNDRKHARTPEEWADPERAAERRARKRAYIRQWHRDHYPELQVKRKARRALLGHW